MKVLFEIDIDFDMESDGEILSESILDTDIIIKTVIDSIDLDQMVDSITEETGFCIKGIGLSEII